MGAVRFMMRVLVSTATLIASVATVAAWAANPPPPAPSSPCELPRKHWALENMRNANPSLTPELRDRYLVASLDTVDSSGHCKGISEIAPPDVPAIAKYRQPPLTRAGDYQGYCIGQTLSLCELSGTSGPVEIARFVTSSLRRRAPEHPAPSREFYPPVMEVASRTWASDRLYTPEVAEADRRMGGGSAKISLFKSKWEMPYFMRVLPVGERTQRWVIGIHEIAGGDDSGGQFGAPVSLGCFRLRDYAAKYVRDWTPIGARMFVDYEPRKYVPRASWVRYF